MLHFLLSWAVLALLLLVFIIHFNAFTRTCTKRSVYVDQNHQTLLSMYCLIPSQHALNAALMQIRITVSSASWSSSIKNAERHIFFQKSQFCFFSFSTLISQILLPIFFMIFFLQNIIKLRLSRLSQFL